MDRERPLVNPTTQPRRASRTAHIVFLDVPVPEGEERDTDPCQKEYYCKACGTTYRPRLPCSLTMFSVMVQQFIREHRHCKPKKGKPCKP